MPGTTKVIATFVTTIKEDHPEVSDYMKISEKKIVFR